MSKKIIKLTEADLHRIVRESVDRIISENYIDDMIESRWRAFNNSKLKPIFDNLGLKRGGGGFSIGGDLGYISLKLYKDNVEIRQYDNGKVFVCFGYDDNAGAWGGYTKKYEVKDPDIFKTPRWKQLIKSNYSAKSPDVVMI